MSLRSAVAKHNAPYTTVNKSWKQLGGDTDAPSWLAFCQSVPPPPADEAAAEADKTICNESPLGPQLTRSATRYGDGVREGGGLRGVIAATQCARAVAAPMGRTATVRVSTLVQTFAGYCAPRACEITTMSPCLSPSQWPRRASEKLWRQSSPAAARRSPRRGLEELSRRRLRASVFTGTLAPAVLGKLACAARTGAPQAREYTQT